MHIIYIKYNKFAQRETKIISTVCIKICVPALEDTCAYASES